MDDIPVLIDSKSKRFIPQLRLFIRKKGLAYSTEKTYLYWILYYIRFHKMQHPKDMASSHVDDFLSYLAIERNVSPSTQRTALNALIFLYKQFLNIRLEELRFSYAKISKRIPVVLSHSEIKRIFENLNEPYLTMVGLMYGSGLRLKESLTLRIMDVDFDRAEIIIRNGKGAKDRVTMLPESMIPGLKSAISKVAGFHQIDLNNGIEHIHLPGALLKKYPNAAKELKWKFIFSSANTSIDPVTGKRGRHHLHKRTIERAIKSAINSAGIMKHVTAHAFRHSFATHLLENGYGRFFAPAKPTYTTSM